MALIPSVHQPATSDWDRRERYISFSLRAADRQTVTLLKLATLIAHNADGMGCTVDAAIESFNSRPEVQDSKFQITQPTASVRTSVS